MRPIETILLCVFCTATAVFGCCGCEVTEAKPLYTEATAEQLRESNQQLLNTVEEVLSVEKSQTEILQSVKQNTDAMVVGLESVASAIAEIKTIVIAANEAKPKEEPEAIPVSEPEKPAAPKVDWPEGIRLQVYAPTSATASQEITETVPVRQMVQQKVCNNGRCSIQYVEQVRYETRTRMLPAASVEEFADVQEWDQDEASKLSVKIERFDSGGDIGKQVKAKPFEFCIVSDGKIVRRLQGYQTAEQLARVAKEVAQRKPVSVPVVGDKQAQYTPVIPDISQIPHKWPADVPISGTRRPSKQTVLWHLRGGGNGGGNHASDPYQAWPLEQMAVSQLVYIHDADHGYGTLTF